ncbi:MAG TPA: hypothetical protein DIU14_07035 [Actinobacteria bacterium]|nr:hypothetical protein [Actinomycetota bacterium]
MRADITDVDPGRHLAPAGLRATLPGRRGRDTIAAYRIAPPHLKRRGLPVATIDIDIDTTLPPERVMAAMLDFTPNRTKIWRGLAPEIYEVYEVGETTAEIREGNVKPVRVWAREHYDWSKPNKVTWTVTESNFCNPGSFVSMDVAPNGTGGSKIHLHWDRTGSTLKGKFMVRMMKLTKGKLIKESVATNLARLAASGQPGPPASDTQPTQ